MKKLFAILAIFVVVVSCSKEEDVSNSGDIRPPEWIQGTWLAEGGTYSGNNLGFRFTSDDMIIIFSGNEISQKGQLDFYRQAGEEASAENVEAGDSYELRFSYPAGQSVIYTFERVSENAILWKEGGIDEYVRQ